MAALILLLAASILFAQQTITVSGVVMETDGGHVWKNWRIYLSVFAQELFK